MRIFTFSFFVFMVFTCFSQHELYEIQKGNIY